MQLSAGTRSASMDPGRPSAHEAKINQTTIRNFENGKTSPQPSTLAVLRQTLERHGVEFNADGRGVRWQAG